MTENTNNIPAPYFSVGEEVILESKDHPEYNGEYVIQAMDYGFGEDVITGKLTVCWSYDLGFTAKHENAESIWWDQAALRKKYPPSEMSFSEMLESFNRENVEAI